MNPDLLLFGQPSARVRLSRASGVRFADPKRFSDADPRIATRTERDVANGWAYRLSSRERRP